MAALGGWSRLKKSVLVGFENAGKVQRTAGERITHTVPLLRSTRPKSYYFSCPKGIKKRVVAPSETTRFSLLLS